MHLKQLWTPPPLPPRIANSIGQLLSEGGLWNDDTVSYTYANRLRTGLSLEAPNSASWTQGYGYDAAKRLTGLSSPAGTFGYAYDPVRNLQVSNLALPNGAYIRNAYDSIARLLSTKLVNSSGTALDSQAYAYNQASQRIGETNLAGDFRNYTYDNSGQLLTAVGKEAGGVTNRLQEQMGYLYDPAGNLNQRTNNNLVETFTVNAANELAGENRSGTMPIAGTTTSAATNVTLYPSPGFSARTATIYADATFAYGGWSAPSGSNSITAVAQDSYGRVATNITILNLPSTNSYTYDANGNLLTDGTRYFTYDDENQLTSITVSNAYQSVFIYDGRMRRRIRKEYGWLSGAWIETNEVRYIYDGNVPIQERDINNLPTTTYTRGPDLSGTLQGAGGIGGLLARTDNGQLIARLSTAHALYHADGNGNVVCLIYTNQQIAARYEYDSFGSITSQSGPLADLNVYRFSSKEFHQNSSLTYFLYRYYDPTLQRWLTRDPLGEIGSVNLYGVGMNDLVNTVDIFGLVKWSLFWKGVAKAIGGLGMVGGSVAVLSNPATGVVGIFSASAFIQLGVNLIGFGVADMASALKGQPSCAPDSTLGPAIRAVGELSGATKKEADALESLGNLLESRLAPGFHGIPPSLENLKKSVDDLNDLHDQLESIRKQLEDEKAAGEEHED